MGRYRVTIPASKRTAEIHTITADSEEEAREEALTAEPDEWVEDPDYYEMDKSAVTIERLPDDESPDDAKPMTGLKWDDSEVLPKELYEIGARHGRSRAEVDAFLTHHSDKPTAEDLHDAVAPVAFIGKAKEELIQLVSRLDQAMDTLVPQDDPRGKDRQFWTGPAEEQSPQTWMGPPCTTTDKCGKCGTPFSQESIDHGRCYGRFPDGSACLTMVCHALLPADFNVSDSEEPDGYAFSPDHLALMVWVQKRLANDRILGPDDRHACAEKLRIALEDRVPLGLSEEPPPNPQPGSYDVLCLDDLPPDGEEATPENLELSMRNLGFSDDKIENALLYVLDPDVWDGEE